MFTRFDITNFVILWFNFTLTFWYQIYFLCMCFWLILLENIVTNKFSIRLQIIENINYFRLICCIWFYRFDKRLHESDVTIDNLITKLMWFVRDVYYLNIVLFEHSIEWDVSNAITFIQCIYFLFYWLFLFLRISNNTVFLLDKRS